MRFLSPSRHAADISRQVGARRAKVIGTGGASSGAGVSAAAEPLEQRVLLSDAAGLLGGLVCGLTPLVVLGLLLVPISYYVLWRTRFGLRLRSCGENPVAAESRVKSMLAENPGAHVLNFTLGNQLAQQGRWAEAQAEYFKAFSAEPANAERVTAELATVVRGVVAVLRDEDVQAVMEQAVVKRVVAVPWGPPLGKLMAGVVEDGTHHSYPTVDLDPRSAVLTRRDRVTDPRLVVPPEELAFADCSTQPWPASRTCRIRRRPTRTRTPCTARARRWR
jgi:hypothetical protein